MSEVIPLQSLAPDEPLPVSHQNPNPNHSPSRSSSLLQCESLARSWLASLPTLPSTADLDAWTDSNLSPPPSYLSSLSRPQLHQWILSLRTNPSPNPNPSPSQVEYPYRFQRTDLWRPVYDWLESVDKDQLVSGKEITDWLSVNKEFMDKVLLRHSKYHLMHYVQKLHLKLLKKRGKLPKVPSFPGSWLYY